MERTESMKWSLATFAVCIALGVQADNIVLKNDDNIFVWI